MFDYINYKVYLVCGFTDCRNIASVHDFKVYKNSIGSAISNNKKVLVNSGYQGLHKFRLNSYIPKKVKIMN